MVTGKLRRFESLMHFAPEAFSQNPERVSAEKSRLAFDLEGAWRVVARSITVASA